MSGTAGGARGEWRGQAYVRDLKQGKSGTFDLDVVAQEPESVRLEVTGPFGVSVASLASNGHEATFLLPREKKYLRDRPDSDRIAALVPVHLAPHELVAVLFDREPTGWTCKRGATGLIVSCAKSSGFSYTVEHPKELTRKIDVHSEGAEAQILLYEAKSKVEVTDQIFSLVPPRDYNDLHVKHE